jgi:eukaryotic-like serine/threonine-protein kinase
MMSQESGSSEGSISIESGEISQPSEDDQITQALEEYARLRREGRSPGREEFLASHGKIAVALGECLDGLELVEDAATHFTPRKARGALATDPSPPAQLGEFRLVREIGHGGIGVVFEAEQVSLGRRVALKVLPSAASVDSRVRRRFQVAAQLAGLLHHEHIVKVFTTGSDAGVHYVAMQFIDGRPLTEVLRELESTVAGNAQAVNIDIPQLALAVVGTGWRRARRARSSSAMRRHCQSAVRWAVQAADALDHAHQIGVVHHDIKPSNLLIDRRGRLWVTDFGLARLPEEKRELTDTGEEVEALRYTSPEQLGGGRGSTDARTDIYGLGVTLYELLTLQPAYTGRDGQELRDRILRHEPPPPRRLNPSIAADLETVVLKAIEKEPSARYRSAREFAADLRRFLADQPVRASRPGVMQRVLKWSSRHRPAVVASASAVVVALAAGMLVLWEAKRRDDATLLEFRRLRAQERTALENALGAIDQITRALMEDRQRAPESPLADEAKRAFPLAIAFSESIPKMYEHDEQMREVVAKALRQAGRSRLILGDARGRNEYRRAIQIYEELAARFPERIWLRTGLIETLHEYASLLAEPSYALEADVSIHRAVEVADTLIGNQSAALPHFRKDLVGPFSGLAWTIVSQARLCPIELAQAIRIAQQAVDWDSERSDAWRSLGMTCYRAGDWNSASSSFRQAIDLDHGGNAADWFLMAAIDHHLGKHEEARRWYDRAVARLSQASLSERTGGVELRRSRVEALKALGMPVPDSQNGPPARVIEAMSGPSPTAQPSQGRPQTPSAERTAP